MRGDEVRPRLDTFTIFIVVVSMMIALGLSVVHELNQPLEVLLPTFEVIDVKPAPLLDLGELGIR